MPTGVDRLTLQDLTGGTGSTFLNQADFFDFDGTDMYFTLFHNLESITGKFKLTYEPGL